MSGYRCSAGYPTTVALLAFVTLPFRAVTAADEQSYPIDLATVLRLAGAQNLDVQIARERVAEARANYETTLEQFFPWAATGAIYRGHANRLQDVAGNILDTRKQSLAAGGSVTAQVDLGDDIYKALQAKQLQSAATYGYDAQRQESLLAAAAGYFALVKAHSIVGVDNESTRIAREYEDQVTRAVEIGIAYKGDQLRAKVQTERNELALREAAVQDVVESARLARTLHLDPTVRLVPQNDGLVPLALVEPAEPLHELVDEALEGRPEVKQASAVLAAARDAERGALYGPLLPSIGGQAFAGAFGGGKNGRMADFGESEDYTAALNWRIGPGGLFDFGRIGAARARTRAAGLALEKVHDDVATQIVETFSRVKSLAEQLAIAKDSVSSAEQSLRLSRERKEFGVGVVLEAIQAEQDWTRVNNDYVGVVSDYNKTQYELVRAVGRLGSASESSVSPQSRQRP